MNDKKPLAQIAYETSARALGLRPESWDVVRRIPVARGVWDAVATTLDLAVRERLALEFGTSLEDARALVAAGRADRAARATNPNRPVKCRCGARFMAGESHICNDNPELLKKLAGAA